MTDIDDYADGADLLSPAGAEADPTGASSRSSSGSMRVAVAGAGAVGRSLARELLVHGHEVLLMDKRGDDLDHDKVPGATWVTADACELSRLEELDLADYDVVVAATGDDKANLVISLLAKTEFAVGRVVARVNDPRNEWLFDQRWGVDVAVSTPRLLVSLVEEAVAVGDVVRLMTLRQGAATLLGITLPEQTGYAGRPLSRLTLPRDTALVAILRGGRVIVPEPDVPLEPRDELLFVSSEESDDELRRAVLGS